MTTLRMINILFTLATLVLLSGELYGQIPAARDKPGNQKPNPEYVTLNLRQVSLRNTLELLSLKMGKNLILDPIVNDERLSMSMGEITPKEAFAAILEAHDLAYKTMQGNVLFVSSIEKIGRQMVVRKISCKYAKASELAIILKNMIASEHGRVMSDPRTNSLILKESPEILTKMQSLTTELDKATQQVYIQAEVLEISTTDDEEIGTEWLWKNVEYESIEGRIGTDFELQRQLTPENSVSVEAVSDIGTDDFPFPNGKSGLGIGILNTDISVVLHALSEMNNVNLLSRPRIVTLDNQQAVIEVGDQIPFRKLNEFGITSFEFKDATIQLLVTPHVIDSTFILLSVSPKADFQNGFTLDGTPIISTRKASTNVKVKNGQTVVIGGLIRDSVVENKKKVPLLGDIPILGNLFKSRKTTKIKTELIFFITPVIMYDDMSTDMFKNEFKLRGGLEDGLN